MSARIVTYPAPPEEAVASDYHVEVNGRPVDVYFAKTQHYDGRYYFASFDFEGEIEVRVTSAAPLRDAVVLPESAGVTSSADGDALLLSASRPFKISIERDGRNSPLLLFGNALEKDAPKVDDPGVVYFGPGIHRPGKVTLADGQTLYLAGGAVVKGAVWAEGENVRILGRGILDGSDYPHAGGPTPFMVTFEKCRNVLMKDVVVRGSWLFTLAPCGCDGVTIDNVKLCGSRVGNDDGIDVINSSNVTIRGCFLRTDDDCIAIKGLAGYDRKACEGITVTDCSFWTDRANIFRIGYESEAEAMRGITARNIDVLHFMPDASTPKTYWSDWIFYLQPSDEMPMSDLLFEEFRINASGGGNNLVKILPMTCKGLRGMEDGRFVGWDYQAPGRYVRDCRFRDIRLFGEAGGGPGRIYVAGADAQHPVEGITFESVLRFGEPAAEHSPEVTVGPYTREVLFVRGKSC